MGDAAVYDLAAVVAERDALKAEKAACEKYLKEDERLDECLERWRADAAAVLDLLVQEKKKSEGLAAEIARLGAACAAKDAALSKALGYVDLDNDALISKCLAALKGTAGTGWIDATGAVEATLECERGDPTVNVSDIWYVTDADLPPDWAGATVKIVRVKP